MDYSRGGSYGSSQTGGGYGGGSDYSRGGQGQTGGGYGTGSTSSGGYGGGTDYSRGGQGGGGYAGGGYTGGGTYGGGTGSYGGGYTSGSYSRGSEWGQQGPYSGRGPQGYQRSNERIKEDVCEILTRHGEVDASNVQVRVENGEITLEGTVNSRREKRLAEDVVEDLPGVREVHNRLRVENKEGGGGLLGWLTGGSSQGESDRDRPGQQGQQAGSTGTSGTSGSLSTSGSTGASGATSGASAAGTGSTGSTGTTGTSGTTGASKTGENR